MTDRDAETALAGAELATYARVSFDHGKEIAPAPLLKGAHRGCGLVLE